MALKTPWFDLAGLSRNDNDKLRRFFEQVDTQLQAGGSSYDILWPSTATFPDNSGSGNAPATLETYVSTASQTANTPKVTRMHALFDSATDEHLMWTVPLPTSFTETIVLTLHWGAKVTSGAVVWKAAVARISTTTDFDTAVFQTPVVSSAITVPGTAGYPTTTELTLTPTSAAIGDLVVVMVGRDTDATGDNAAGDAVLYYVDPNPQQG